ncbi:hypothetical protein VN97_g2442 [Penicillium thymicola]|uniref:Uncharacterized protein n=1 Tax=Penicillium thymicola TaxID=293382 RepID=A0AAI9TPU1_PENTH|nr:hypothetical protein VN97_g2442 [Penicillium thymicola]
MFAGRKYLNCHNREPLVSKVVEFFNFSNVDNIDTLRTEHKCDAIRTHTNGGVLKLSRIWYDRLQRLETGDFKDLCGGNSFNITREASI